MTLPALPPSGSTSWYSWATGIHTAATLPAKVTGPAPSGDTSGVTDTAALTTALTTTASNIYLHPNCDYYINATLPLGNVNGLIGAGTQSTQINWVGPVGGKMLSTDPLTSTVQLGWFGTLRDLRLIYPPAKMSATSRAIYIAQPAGPIENVSIDTGETTVGSVVGAYGIELDGCANPGGTFPVRANVIGHWEGGVYARCNHAIIQGGFAYGDWAVVVNDDSLNSSAGPPYDLSVTSLHAFFAGLGVVRVVKCNSAQIVGGLNEGNGVSLQIENGAGGAVKFAGMTTTTGSHLQHYDPVCIVDVDNQQTNDHNQYVGTTGTGVPVATTARIAARQTVGITASGTTTGPTVVGFLGPIKNGPLGQFHCQFLGQAESNTVSQPWTVSIYQCPTVPTVTASPPAGSTLVKAFTPAAADTPANAARLVALDEMLGSQNTTCYFAVTVTVTGGGAAVGQTTGRLTVEAI